MILALIDFYTRDVEPLEYLSQLHHISSTLVPIVVQIDAGILASIELSTCPSMPWRAGWLSICFVSHLCEEPLMDICKINKNPPKQRKRVNKEHPPLAIEPGRMPVRW